MEGLANEVKRLVAKHGVDLKVAYVDGDDCTDAVLDLYSKGEDFPNLPAGKKIQDWGFEPICAQCYLGATGIATCFAGMFLPPFRFFFCVGLASRADSGGVAGADIVVCGRVADASPTVGAAMWWHGWTREENLQEVATALMVGTYECSPFEE